MTWTARPDGSPCGWPGSGLPRVGFARSPDTGAWLDLPGHAGLADLAIHLAHDVAAQVRRLAAPALAPITGVVRHDDGVRLLYGAVSPEWSTSGRAASWRVAQAGALVAALRHAHAAGLVHGALTGDHLAWNADAGHLQWIGVGASAVTPGAAPGSDAARQADRHALAALLPAVLTGDDAADLGDVEDAPVRAALRALTDPAAGERALADLQAALQSMDAAVPGVRYGLVVPARIQARLWPGLEEALTGPLLIRRSPGRRNRIELYAAPFGLELGPASQHPGVLEILSVSESAGPVPGAAPLTEVHAVFDRHADSAALLETLHDADVAARVDAWPAYRRARSVLTLEQETFEARQHLRAAYVRAEAHEPGRAVFTFGTVTPWLGSVAGPGLPDWADAFERPQDLTLRQGGRVIGRGVGWRDDGLDVLLDDRAGGEVPRRGEVELVDVGREVLLKRCHDVMEAVRDGRAAHPRLVPVLLEPATARSGPVPALPPLYSRPLEATPGTRELIGRMMASTDVFALQGPPGTGKTTIITELILQELRRNPRIRILVTAQAHAAVQNVFERLDAVRTGPDEERPGRFLTYLHRRSPEDTSGFLAWARAVRERSAARDPHLLTAWHVGVTSGPVRDAYVNAASVFGCTLMGLPALLQTLPQRPDFDVVIIDEAARATLPELLTAALQGQRVVLVGDHRQLPPFLETAGRDHLLREGHTDGHIRRSLFEELFTGDPERGTGPLPDTLRHTLGVQYRMHDAVARIVSEAFYGGQVRSGPRGPDALHAAGLGDDRALWWDCAGRPVRDGSSWRNDRQSRAALTALHALDRRLAPAPPPTPLRAAVICGYRAHVREMSRLLAGERFACLQVDVNTVDAVQGQERDVIVYVTGRPLGVSAFLADPQRLNVAFSRARQLLVIIGDRRGSLVGGRLSRVRTQFASLPAEFQREGRRVQ